MLTLGPEQKPLGICYVLISFYSVMVANSCIWKR